jgi:hypothetical protein
MKNEKNRNALHHKCPIHKGEQMNISMSEMRAQTWNKYKILTIKDLHTAVDLHPNFNLIKASSTHTTIEVEGIFINMLNTDLQELLAIIQSCNIELILVNAKDLVSTSIEDDVQIELLNSKGGKVFQEHEEGYDKWSDKALNYDPTGFDLSDPISFYIKKGDSEPVTFPILDNYELQTMDHSKILTEDRLEEVIKDDPDITVGEEEKYLHIDNSIYAVVKTVSHTDGRSWRVNCCKLSMLMKCQSYTPTNDPLDLLTLPQVQFVEQPNLELIKMN